MTTTKILGTSIPRVDSPSKVRGTRKYPTDFNMDGQLYGKIVWAAHPHARVRHIDTSEAEALHGVVRVITYKDVPVNNYSISGSHDQHVFAPEGGKVRWLGDRIALVVAETEAIAEQACHLVHVDYEVLSVVDDPREAMKPDALLVQENRESNVMYERHVHRGDVEAGFAEADVVVEGTYTTPYVEHVYTQPDAGIVNPGLTDVQRLDVSLLLVRICHSRPQDFVHDRSGTLARELQHIHCVLYATSDDELGDQSRLSRRQRSVTT